ncbi:MAG: SGNH/GDSL hydrolase family protein [Sphingobium sp.]
MGQATAAHAQSDPVARALSARALTEARTAAQIDRLRRAAQRAAANNPEEADLASGVTMSVSATPDAALTTIYNAGPSAALFATSGGRPTAAGGAANSQFLYFPVASVAPATNGNVGAVLTATPDYAAWGWSAAFETDSDRVEIRLSTCATCLFRVRVDGRYVGRTGTAGVNYVAYVLVDFAGVRRPRTITVEASDTNALRGVAVRPTSNIWRPTGEPDRIVAIATGDSYSEGQGASSPGLFAWPKILGRLMGWSDVRQVAVGGTGYLNWGGGLNRSRISAQIGRWLIVNNDLSREDVAIVTVAAGYNDHGAVGGTIYPPEEIATQALADWRAIRALLPRATIVVMGPHAGARGPDGRTQAIEAALQARFVQWRDANALFVPVVGAGGTTPWIFGTGRVGAPTGNGNADIAISSDGVHPSDAGHMIYARRAAAAIRAELGRRGR